MSPCPPKESTKATLSLIDGRPAADVESPPAKLMPTMPTFPSDASSGCFAIQATVSSITSGDLMVIE
jgi:hypothetical protein